MHIGLIGLGKMGFNMRERMRNGGIVVTGFDRNPDVTDVASVDELIAALLRKLMAAKGMAVPPEGRTLESICITEACDTGQ